MTDRASPPISASVPVWTPFRRKSAGPVTVYIEHRDPGDLRLSIDLGFAAIVALGVEDASDLIAAFSMAVGEPVACRRYGFVIEELGDGDDCHVVYRDKETEVRLTRPEYDRIAGIVADLLADPSVHSLFQGAFRSHAAAAHAAAWEPLRPEA